MAFDLRHLSRRKSNIFMIIIFMIYQNILIYSENLKYEFRNVAFWLRTSKRVNILGVMNNKARETLIYLEPRCTMLYQHDQLSEDKYLKAAKACAIDILGVRQDFIDLKRFFCIMFFFLLLLCIYISKLTDMV